MSLSGFNAAHFTFDVDMTSGVEEARPYNLYVFLLLQLREIIREGRIDLINSTLPRGCALALPCEIPEGSCAARQQTHSLDSRGEDEIEAREVRHPVDHRGPRHESEDVPRASRNGDLIHSVLHSSDNRISVGGLLDRHVVTGDESGEHPCGLDVEESDETRDARDRGGFLGLCLGFGCGGVARARGRVGSSALSARSLEQHSLAAGSLLARRRLLTCRLLLLLGSSHGPSRSLLLSRGRLGSLLLSRRHLLTCRLLLLLLKINDNQ
mmetsp:Transcript_23958/g.74947  ORF Transcript_23958/g.74947 Transcript_23958/m.74947 type:complete len:267 (-) Transcript_23958:1800-2600(-)